MKFKFKIGRFLAWMSFVVSSLMMLTALILFGDIARSGLRGFLLVAFFYTCVATTHIYAFKYSCKGGEIKIFG